MSKREAFFDSLHYDDEGQVIWPTEPGERGRVAEGLFGSRIIDAVTETADEMLSRVDGRWPAPGSQNYEEEIKVAQLFASMSPEQRKAVSSLVAQTARLTGYSIFLAMEHFGYGSIKVRVLPISRGALDGDPVQVNPVEWHVGYLDWEEEFGERP
jgi:hypothetical protein